MPEKVATPPPGPTVEEWYEAMKLGAEWAWAPTQVMWRIRSLLSERDGLRDALVFADGLAVDCKGYGLADLYSETSSTQAILASAGCWPRGAIAVRQAADGVVEHELNGDETGCSCGWAGEDGHRHMFDVIAELTGG